MLKKFILRIALLGASLFVLITTLFFLTMPRYDEALFRLPTNRNVLVCGDSRTAVSVNDSIFTRGFNISYQAEYFFYTYLKLKKILPLNPQIDTVLLSYSYFSLTRQKDRWGDDPNILKRRLPIYAPIMSLPEFADIASIAPLTVISSLGEITRQNAVKRLAKRQLKRFNDLDMGGYFGWEVRGGEWKKQHDSESRADIDKRNQLLSSPAALQVEYLKKIEALCKSRRVTLILLSAPIHVTDPDRDNALSSLTKFCPGVDFTLVDHSALPYPDSVFADAVHFNPRGAALYSRLLQSDGVRSLADSISAK